MDQPEQPKTSNIPPWKLPQKHLQYSGMPDDPESKPGKKPLPTKWILITILLLLVTNVLTAAYFLNRGRQSAPQSGGDSATTVPPGSGTRSLLPGYNPFVPDYGAALGKANDTKRRADLTALSTALNQYMVEYGPGDLPTSSQCIGTSAGCYNLASILTPDYLQTLPIDPSIGTQINTGYSFYYDELQGFVLEAISEEGLPITIIR